MAQENDIVLIYLEEKPISFARVEAIRPDVKKDWFQIKLLMLQIPLQAVTWILKDLYINGEEFFMGGKKMKLEVVTCPDETNLPAEDDPVVPKEDKGPDEPGVEKKESETAKIISFADMKKAKLNNGADR